MMLHFKLFREYIFEDVLLYRAIITYLLALQNFSGS